ncbi:Protein OS-9 [Saxophila tyrrhenica]|uniref:Endoplasmic reticulum lectin n=1 Tax=Saxophila tyrrhenica TaxID=1690608 RepID=A0AAV9PPW0_9PEZI|nr:Protein OS-9 [Saxophila tyrrhenica]
MKRHSFLALPALLRTTLLAAASQTTFSVQDDLLAFPQYDVKFEEEDYVLEAQARVRLHSSEEHAREEAGNAPPSQIEHYRPADSRQRNNDPDGGEKLEYEYMYLDGQPYMCSIPQVSKRSDAANAANDTVSKAEEERELARANERGWELLSGMQGNCVYFISGWWSYKFCYNDGVRQFHQLPPSRGVPVYPPVEDPGVEGYTLGMYSGENKQAETGTDVGKASKVPATGELVQRGESRYLVQRLSGGTKCDLTGKDRRVEVQFHCNTQPPTDRISLIKETSTCAYLMVIQTPRLCNDVAFLPPQKDSPNSISCTPILDESQVDDYKRDTAALKAAEKEARIWESHVDAAKVFLGSTGDFQLVGDTIVGGHNIVPEDVKIEKSAIVGGGKETYIDTVASSDGKVLSKEAIEKLGLGDAKSVEKLRKKLEEIAKGQEWKLDVIDTPQGREYRGIIGDGRDEKEDEKQGKDEKSQGEGEEQEQEQEGSKEEYYKEEL